MISKIGTSFHNSDIFRPQMAAARLIFETDSLAETSPSFLCRCCTVPLPLEATETAKLPKFHAFSRCFYYFFQIDKDFCFVRNLQIDVQNGGCFRMRGSRNSTIFGCFLVFLGCFKLTVKAVGASRLLQCWYQQLPFRVPWLPTPAQQERRVVLSSCHELEQKKGLGKGPKHVHIIYCTSYDLYDLSHVLSLGWTSLQHHGFRMLYTYLWVKEILIPKQGNFCRICLWNPKILLWQSSTHTAKVKQNWKKS